MGFPIVFDLGFTHRDPEHIYLLGLPGGRAAIELGGTEAKAYTHTILPGFTECGDDKIFGTLELRYEGRCGSEKGKFFQCYSPLSHVIKAAGEYSMMRPKTMKSLRGRKVRLLRLVDCILANLDKVGGMRREIRSHVAMASVDEEFGLCDSILDSLYNYMMSPESDICIKRIHVEDYRAFLREEVKAAVEHKTFQGIRDAGPQGQEQEDAFRQKIQQWAWLLSNIGIYSGQFARLVCFIQQGTPCEQQKASPRNTSRRQAPRGGGRASITP